jgi:hypothetical protein
MVDLEDLLELPDIGYRSADIGSARQQTSVLMRLPSIPGAAVEKFFAQGRQESALEYAVAQGIAYQEDRDRAVIMRAKARAQARLAQAIAEGRV